MKKVKENLFGIMAVLFIAVVIFAVNSKFHERDRATALLLKASEKQLKEKEALDIPDYYGTNFKFEKTSTEECVTLVTTSAGADRIFGNEDDISCTQRDYNNSRMVGKWISKKSKEFFKGLINGFWE